MQRGIFAFTILSVLSTGLIARAATLTTTAGKDGNVTVSLNGEITDGDSDALKTIIQTANDDGHFVALVRLNSPGGSVLEGVKIAEIIQFGKISTSVIGKSICASACFVVFAAGSEKYVNYTASVGVHGASNQSGEETVQSSAATVTMARIVKELGVPPSIIGKMVITPPDEVVWLTPDDLRSMGTTMTGKPAQVPTNQSSLSQLPSQLRPQEKSSENSPPPTWENILDRGIELSIQQHGGKADIQRVCQPEFSVCINGLAFNAKDGTHMIMKVTEDMNGKMLKRELCSFNSYGDVRTCLNWDTREKHRDMRNKDGDWYKVDSQQ
jgi:hypothetical protein